MLREGLVYYSLNPMFCQILFLIENIAICAKLLCINALHLLTHLHQHAIALTEKKSLNLHSFMLNSHLYRLSLQFLSPYRSLSQGSTNSNMLDVQGGAHKKRARRSSLLNAKKLYEDAQMARKVKQYLSSLDIDTDEEKFQMISLQWEPAYGTCEYFLFHHTGEHNKGGILFSPISADFICKDICCAQAAWSVHDLQSPSSYITVGAGEMNSSSFKGFINPLLIIEALINF